MLKKYWWVFLILALLVISFLNILPEPVEHKTKVNFWTWLKNELLELKYGEGLKKLKPPTQKGIEK